MKTKTVSINKMMKSFDKELKIRLVSDLKLIKSSGSDIVNNVKKLEPNRLMIA